MTTGDDGNSIIAAARKRKFKECRTCAEIEFLLKENISLNDLWNGSCGNGKMEREG